MLHSFDCFKHAVEAHLAFLFFPSTVRVSDYELRQLERVDSYENRISSDVLFIETRIHRNVSLTPSTRESIWTPTTTNFTRTWYALQWNISKFH